MNDQQPVISIATVSLNAEATIERTLKSVVEQHNVQDRIEHIVIDGASTDGTLEIVRRFPHVRWQSESDKGISDAFNKGLNLAHGEYILYLNADDFLIDPEVLSDTIDFIQRSNHPDWIVGKIAVETKRGLKTLSAPTPPTCKTLYLRNRVPHPAVFMKTELLRQVGAFDLQYKYAMDYDLWARLCMAGHAITFFNRTVSVFSLAGQSQVLNDVHKRELRMIYDRLRDSRLKVLLAFLFTNYKKVTRGIRKLIHLA